MHHSFQGPPGGSADRSPSYRNQALSLQGPFEVPAGGAELLQQIKANPAQASLLESELRFYETYAWSLNPFLTVDATIAHLREEVIRLRTTGQDWQLREVMTNVFLLSGTLLNSLDDYLRGPAFTLPKKALRLPLAHLAQKGLKAFERSTRVHRCLRYARINRWKREWQAAFEEFLQLFVREDLPEPRAIADVADRLTSRLTLVLPAELRNKHIRIPSAFRKQDLTPFDGLALGRKFVSRFPDRQQPILIAGLRTAGAYLAPLLRAFLEFQGYRRVRVITVRPRAGLAAWERAELRRCARAQYLLAVVDEAPLSCSTIGLGVELMRRAGFQSKKIVIMFPVRLAGRDWRAQPHAAALLGELVVCLEPEEWHKERLLARETVEVHLREYFLRRNYVTATVVEDAVADKLNARFLEASTASQRCRLKRIFALLLEMQDGRTETLFVLAKGVGYGWFGYSGFLTGSRLSGFVPPLLGLRDGILYSEWLPQAAPAEACEPERSYRIKRTAEYVAARVLHLGLAVDAMPSLGLDSQHEGYRVLTNALCGAYGSRLAARLVRGQIRRQLARLPSPFPTLIDGKMSPSEWVANRSELLKTDFEHHGFGKDELNVTDPAYDLADAILQLELSASEEEELVRCYVEQTGDAGIPDRLFFGKLLAGIWSMESSLAGALGKPQPGCDVASYNVLYIRAWNFLTRMTARFCGDLCHRSRTVSWHSPLVVMDIDGVLDRRIFGFPTTTAAGIKALRYLHDHGFAIAVDTARSVGEVRDYCSAYGFAGGVAEYGSCIIDAVANREKRIVGSEALEQLDRVREALRTIPGVFVNEGYRYSIRAYTYNRKGMTPLPESMVPEIMYRLSLRQLRCHQTSIDTTVLSNEVDKGRGLAAMLEWVGLSELETIAIGDSEPDLAMFLVASQCFAPGKIGCSDLVRALGGRIARHPNQRGLLTIARWLAQSKGPGVRDRSNIRLECGDHHDLFLRLLEVADGRPSSLLLRALLNPIAFQVFAQS
jgi:hydroxymethylpyrimidine pyrophosphatase-like HAD family hydrolase